MVYRCVSRTVSTLVLSWGLMVAALPVQAKENLIWLLRDLPPLTLFEGPQKGQGAVDQLLPILIANMPEYEHSIQRVNRARGMQMLQDPATFTCDPALLWTAERAKFAQFSIPMMAMNANGLVIRRQDRSLVASFVQGGKLDLAKLLAAGDLKLGVIAERSYGSVIDGLLKNTPADHLAPHYGNDALGSLLQMQRLERLKVLLGYWPEIRYQAQQQGIAPQELEFYPIAGSAKYNFIRVACTESAEGRKAVTHINQILRPLRQQQLVNFYAGWLDPQLRSEYLEDAKEFFQKPEDQ